MIIGCSHGTYLAKKIARNLNAQYLPLTVGKFPDNELYIRFNKSPKNKNVVLVQSFYGNINDCVVEVLFAAATARDLGAKKIALAAPHFPYLRQDRRFNPGECISIKALSGLINRHFDKVFIVAPHLHRQAKLSGLFKIPAVNISANNCIADYIKKTIKNPMIVGPDWESHKWAQKVAEQIGCDYLILRKKRHSGRKVKVTSNQKIRIDNKTIVLVDDIISTGNTILEAVKKLRKLGAKNFHCIAVHGIFVENALEKLRKASVRVVTTNTIPNNVSKIDVSKLISKKLI
jgi:ribose-phosphate pyrophosphokinase